MIVQLLVTVGFVFAIAACVALLTWDTCNSLK